MMDLKTAAQQTRALRGLRNHLALSDDGEVCREWVACLDEVLAAQPPQAPPAAPSAEQGEALIQALERRSYRAEQFVSSVCVVSMQAVREEVRQAIATQPAAPVGRAELRKLVMEAFDARIPALKMNVNRWHGWPGTFDFAEVAVSTVLAVAPKTGGANG
jgi:hypothetical protein